MEGRPDAPLPLHTDQIVFDVIGFFRKLLRYLGLGPPSRIDAPFYENPGSAPDHGEQC